jgi:hypothetical protein
MVKCGTDSAQKEFSLAFFRRKNLMDDNNYEKYCDPCQANVIKRYCPLERVSAELGAVGVVLIPVDATSLGRTVEAIGNGGLCKRKHVKMV